VHERGLTLCTMSRQDMMARRRQTVFNDINVSDDGFDLLKELQKASEEEEKKKSYSTPDSNGSRSPTSTTSNQPPVFPTRINVTRRDRTDTVNTPSPKIPASPVENHHISPISSQTPSTPSTPNNNEKLKQGTITRIYRKFTTLLKPNNLFQKGRAEAVRFVPDRKPASNPTTIKCEDIETELALVVQERAGQNMVLHKLSVMYMKMRSKKEDSHDLSTIGTPTTTASPLDNMDTDAPATPSTPSRQAEKKLKEYFEERLVEVTRSQHLLIYKLTNQVRAQLPHNPPIDYEKCFMLSDDFSVHAGGLNTIKLKGGKSTQAYVITITFLAFYTLTFAVSNEDEYEDWLDVFRVHVMRNTAAIPFSSHVSSAEETELKIIEEYNMLVEQREEWARTMGNDRYIELMRAYADTILKNKS
jgi:hypothetical protein